MKKFMATVAMAAALVLAPSVPIASAAEPAPCAPREAGGPVWVTPECVDESYASPVIDSESDISQPAEVRLVKGHFDGTNIEFRIYLPKANSWEGRFFQFTYPLDGQEPVDSVKFGATHGGYTVQTTGTAGYRHIAAAAKFSRSVAADYYGVTPTLFTDTSTAGAEAPSRRSVPSRTPAVCQRAVPIGQELEVSTRDNFSIRAQPHPCCRAKESHRSALRPGGSGDPYAVLNAIERAVLEEVTRQGELWAAGTLRLSRHHRRFRFDQQPCRGFDPTSFEDFGPRRATTARAPRSGISSVRHSPKTRTVAAVSLCSPTIGTTSLRGRASSVTTSTEAPTEARSIPNEKPRRHRPSSRAS